MEVSAELIQGVLVALVGGGGLFVWLGKRGETKVDLVHIAQDAAAAVIKSLREEVDRLTERTVQLEDQDERCRAELAEIKRRIG